MSQDVIDEMDEFIDEMDFKLANEQAKAAEKSQFVEEFKKEYYYHTLTDAAQRVRQIFHCTGCNDADHPEDLFINPKLVGEILCWNCTNQCFNRCGRKQVTRPYKHISVFYLNRLPHKDTIREFCATCYKLTEGINWRNYDE